MNTYIDCLDDEQRKHIREDIDTNMFVEAGAGAGKTTSIVGRVMRQFQSGNFPPESIVIITFTNAAAEELRERITKEVARRVVLDSNDPDYVEHRYLDQLDRMNISTIHSFCNTILSEKSIEVELPVAAKLLENEEYATLLKDYFEDWLSRLKKEQWEELDAFSNKAPRRSIKNAIFKFFLSMEAAGEDANIVIPSYDDSAAKKELAKEIIELWEDICAVFDMCCTFQMKERGLSVPEFVSKNTKGAIESRGNAATNIIKEYVAYKQTLSSSDDADPDSLLLLLKRFVSKEAAPTKNFSWFAPGKGNDKKTSVEQLNRQIYAWFTGDTSEIDALGETLTWDSGAIKERQKYLDEKQQEVRSSAGSDLKYRTYALYAREALYAFRRDRDKKELTNNLLLYKMKLLMEKQEVREYYAKRYKSFYVDEFQDTDHIQADFIWNLAAEPTDLSKLRNGALFVVGDPKQSIYRFRGADPEVFFAIKDKMENLSNAEVFFLSKNYRSNEKIIEWVDAYFSRVKMVAAGNYQGMETVKYLPSSDNVSVKRLAGFYHLKDSLIDLDVDQRELVTVIKNLMAGGYKIYDADLKMERTIRYSDFLVLFDSHTLMPQYVECFLQAQIPVNVMGEIQVDSDYAVKSFLRIYSAITGRFHKAKQMGAIEALRYSGYQVPDLDTTKPLEEQLIRYYEEVIENIRKRTRSYSAYGKAEYLMRHPEYFMKKEEALDQFRVIAILSRIQQMLENCAAEAYDSEDTLIQAFHEYKDKVLERELPMIENEDSVRLMNLHKAKGLEGNIVIWAKRDCSHTIEGSAYRKENLYYPGYREGLVRWISYENEGSLLMQATKEAEMEYRRLEYVAATRAKQAFIFLNIIDGKENILFDRWNMGSDFNRLYDKLPFESFPKLEEVIAGVGIPLATAIPVNEKYDIKDFTIAPQLCEDQTLQDKITKRSYSPSHFEVKGSTKTILGREAKAEEEQKQTIYDPEAGMEIEKTASIDEELAKTEKEALSKRPIGTIVGNVLHRAFELAVKRVAYHECGNIDSLAKLCVHQAISENAMDIPADKKIVYEKFVLAAVCAGMKHYEQKGYLRDKKEINTELQFSFYENNQEGDSPFEREDDENLGTPILVNGFMDLLIIDSDNHALILDYKSDEADNLSDEQIAQALTKKYSPQITMYKKAVQKLYGINGDAIDAALIYFRDYDFESGSIRVCELAL